MKALEPVELALALSFNVSPPKLHSPFYSPIPTGEAAPSAATRATEEKKRSAIPQPGTQAHMRGSPREVKPSSSLNWLPLGSLDLRCAHPSCQARGRQNRDLIGRTREAIAQPLIIARGGVAGIGYPSLLAFISLSES